VNFGSTTTTQSGVSGMTYNVTSQITVGFLHCKLGYFDFSLSLAMSCSMRRRQCKLIWTQIGMDSHFAPVFFIGGGRQSPRRSPGSSPLVLRRTRDALCKTVSYTLMLCLCGSLAQCALSLKRLSAGPGFNPQTRLNKLFHDYWRACFEIYFSDMQEGLTVSSIICDR